LYNKTKPGRVANATAFVLLIRNELQSFTNIPACTLNNHHYWQLCLYSVW